MEKIKITRVVQVNHLTIHSLIWTRIDRCSEVFETLSDQQSSATIFHHPKIPKSYV